MLIIRKNKGRFCNTIDQSLWFTPQFKAISEFRQKKFSQAENQNRRSRKVALKPVRQTLVWCDRREVLREVMCLQRNKKAKSKVLSCGFCLLGSESDQRALHF